MKKQTVKQTVLSLFGAMMVFVLATSAQAQFNKAVVVRTTKVSAKPKPHQGISLKPSDALDIKSNIRICPVPLAPLGRH